MNATSSASVQYDLVVRNATLPDGRVATDIAVRDGKIAAVAPHADLVAVRGATELDAQGQLVTPPFVDAHFHMDATLSYGLPRVNVSGTLLEGIALWGELKPSLTVQALVDRALAYCDWAVGRGLLAIRWYGSFAPLACCSRTCSASNAPNSSAPSSALPGRQEANTVSAMQTQPRPLIMPKKNELKADMVRNAPPTAISAEPATTAPMRTAVHRTRPSQFHRRRVVARRPDREAQRRAREHDPPSPAPWRSASQVSAVCWLRMSPRKGMSRMKSGAIGAERLDGAAARSRWGTATPT